MHKLIILSGCSGSGKGTVVELLSKRKDICILKSYTTRVRRNNNSDNYHFVSRDEFMNMKNRGLFIEWNCYNGNWYATPKEELLKMLKKTNVLLEIDTNGRQTILESGKFDNVVSIFIVPPSAEELLSRLINRGTETKDSIRERMKEAIKELDEIDKYDYVIINDEVQKALDKVNTAIDQEYMADNVSFEVNRFKEELSALLRRL